MSDQIQQNSTGETTAPVKKKSRVAKVFRVSGVLLLLLILTVLVVNALLTLFKDDYYTTFGNYRLFAIVTDSMEPEIPTGSMIVCTKPISESEITAGTGNGDGTVITFRFKSGNEHILLTHRVVSVSENSQGQRTYTTRGDHAGGNDSGTRTFEDIVGIYTGKKCGFFGSLFGFFQSALGVSMLIFTMFVILVAWVVMWYVNRTEIQRSLRRAALKKSAETLSTISLRYDNIHEITAVMDVLGMVTDTPSSTAQEKEIAERLRNFIHAENIELPQTPETLAILDTLPAPDTPGSLAAALSTGATLRQAEDGQTLVLTSTSGEKNIMLTPVQTADGIMLCQQGVRVRADIAPNIEEVGITSMPASPEFFEGQPLEKHIEYPELPQPMPKLGPDELLTKDGAQKQYVELPTGIAAPAPSGQSRRMDISSAQPDRQDALPEHDEQTKALPEHDEQPYVPDEQQSEQFSDLQSEPTTELPEDLRSQPYADEHEDVEPISEPQQSKDRRAYSKYRETSSQLELKQAEQLNSLLYDAAPLSYEEQLKVAEYKAANAKPKRPRKPKTPEQLAAAKQRAEQRKAERDAFLNELSPEDRELYITEEKLAKSREATIRRLKRIAADRKLLDKLD